jgi:SNF2 family DNA or RNA helicase
MEVNYKFKTKPYEHQREAMHRSITMNAFGFFMEMGTGKSKVLIDSVAYLGNTHQIDFALIIAPKGVYRNWINKEIPEHFPNDIQHTVCAWQANQTQGYKKEAKNFFFSEEPGVKIFVMNVEAFSSSKGKAAGEWMAEKFGRFGLIAIDESTTIKNHKAKRTKSLLKIAAKFKYRRLLTGSPVTKSPMDLFSQFQFLNPMILGFDSYYAFQGRYAVMQKRNMGAHSFQQILGYRNLEELTDKIDPFTFRVLKKDCLDLPDKTYTVRNVGLTMEQIRMYKDLQKEALTLLESGELVSAPQVITQMLRLQQVLSGHIKTDEGEMIEIPTQRLSAMMDCIEEVSGKIIIWSRFRYDIVHIQNELAKVYGKDSVVSYYGDTSDQDRQIAIDRFQNGNARFFVANPATAGYGLTLTEANTVIYYANDFNLETRIQSEDRCHRIGQKNPVTYIDLIADGTIDEKIVKALRDKIDIGARVLGEEAREWLKLTPKSQAA